uniref:hypothetical protein n=1 Tax=Stappia sp. TaxID=1870903 RepID=UPI003BAA9494
MMRLAPLLLSAIATDFGALLRRLRRQAIVWVLAGFLAIMAYIAAMAAAGIALAAETGAFEAALILALGHLAAAVLLVAGLMIGEAIARRRRERNRALDKDRNQALLATALTVGAAHLPGLLRSRGALGAAALGVVALLALRSRGTPSD